MVFQYIYKNLFFCLFLFFCSSAISQTIKVCFKTDPPAHSFSKLTIHASDKTVFTIETNKDTCIPFNITKYLTYIFQAEAEGFLPMRVFVDGDTLTNNQKITIVLKQQINELQQVTVTANRQIHQNGDTLFIPVDSIETRPHANAAELLNKVPGMQVSENGMVTVQGQSIDKIKVDGKEIFGGNAKATLDNIQADMIRDLQVTSSVTSGNRELNLKLKEDKKSGIYGAAYAQYGTGNRMNYGIKANRISSNGFANFFVNYNNQNQEVLTPLEAMRIINFNTDFATNTLATQKLYYNFLVNNPLDNLNYLLNDNRFLNKGIKKTLSSGVNISKVYSNKLSWDNFILFNSSSNFLHELNNVTRFLSPLTGYDTINKTTTVLNTSMRAESVLKWKPDTKNLIQLKLSADYKNIHDKIDETEKSILYNNDSIKLLQQNTIQFSENKRSENSSISTQAFWEHRYQKPAQKTTISAGSFYNFPRVIQFYQNTITGEVPLYNYSNYIHEVNSNHSLYAAVQHSFPVNKKFLVDVRWSGILDKRRLNRNAYNYNVQTHAFDTYSQLLSAYDYNFNNNRMAVQGFLFYKTKRLSLAGGIGALNTNWQITQADTSVNRNKATYLLPSLFINYALGKAAAISFKYNTEQQTPQTEQLSPYVDSSSYQQVMRGNVLLTPFMQNNAECNLNFFIKKVGSTSTSVSYSHTHLPVITSYLQNGAYPLLSYAQFRSADEISVYTSLFSFNPGKKINPYFFVFYQYRNQYQLFQNTLSNVKFSSLVPQMGAKCFFTKEHMLDVNIQAVFNHSQFENSSNKSSSQQYNFTIKDDNLLPGKIYAQTTLKWAVSTADKTSAVNKPLVNFSFSKYLTKKENFQINAGVNNLFNLTLVKQKTVSDVQLNESSYNFLPRCMNVGFTYFPEKWK